ncbi:BFR2 [Sanghuangporus sanghuang]
MSKRMHILSSPTYPLPNMLFSPGISLAQQLAQLDQPAPVDFDPEDVAVTNIEAEESSEEHSSTAREHYVDVGPSVLRDKLQESLVDPKYEGKRISRKQLEVNDDKCISDDMPGDIGSRPVTSEDESENSEEEGDGNSGVPKAQKDLREVASNPPEDSKSAPQRSDDHDLSSTLKRAREEERKKGKAIARQLSLFDGLLDARIRLQKCGTAMNRLPDSPDFPVYLDESESSDGVNKFLSESLSLVDELFNLQEKLITTNEGVQVPSRKRRRIDYAAEVNPDWEDLVQERSSHFSELEASFHPHCLATLQKWSNKVLAIAPSALLPNRTKFSSKNSNQVKSAVQLVDEALLEREKLIARTRVWRGTSNQLGAGRSDLTASKPEGQSEDSAAIDIFDDTDFYQALLRDVIDAHSGSGGATAGLDGITADWRTTQQQRKKARQKTIDTRASKGRKLRFDVHEKLQNFMAPAPQPGGTAWHEEQTDELFASLLGKGFGTEAGPVPAVESQPEMDGDVDNALKGGFRVFG